MIYNIVGCGGTFDHLHVGHKAFLRFVFAHGKNVLIGLTSDTYVAMYKKGNNIASFDSRRKHLENFLHEEGFFGRYEIKPIDSIFGPAIDSDSNLDALVTTEETKHGAEKINEKRIEHGLQKLPIVTMPLIEKNGESISSTRIRAGEIDREGNSYVDESFLHDLLLLPESLRTDLQIPFGTVYTDNEDLFSTVIASQSVVVGDATAVAFHQRQIYPQLTVVDFVVQREKTYTSLTEEGFLGKEKEHHVLNPSGTITPALWLALDKAVQHLQEFPSVIVVEGEEDLAVLPLILLLPLGFTVFYGQPNEGIVQVLVDKKTKDKAKSLLEQFKRT